MGICGRDGTEKKRVRGRVKKIWEKEEGKRKNPIKRKRREDEEKKKRNKFILWLTWHREFLWLVQSRQPRPLDRPSRRLVELEHSI